MYVWDMCNVYTKKIKSKQETEIISFFLFSNNIPKKNFFPCVCVWERERWIYYSWSEMLLRLYYSHLGYLNNAKKRIGPAMFGSKRNNSHRHNHTISITQTHNTCNQRHHLQPLWDANTCTFFSATQKHSTIYAICSAPHTPLYLSLSLPLPFYTFPLQFYWWDFGLKS